MKDDSGHSPILALDAQQPQARLIRAAAAALRSGRIVVFPTDTVYGLGLLVASEANAQSLFAAKSRPADKPVPLLIASPQELDTYAQQLPTYARALASKHWPGALTLVVQAADAVPRQFVATDGSVALRVPNSPIALALLHAVGAPIATTSANISGAAPALSVAELDTRLATQAALIIDGGPLAGQPSTLVSCLGSDPQLLRQGAVKI
jgi:tRNA threonylcarbamoyl adenosine modification protein (Sua5/YciO/YrdC/YwlC family)